MAAISFSIDRSWIKARWVVSRVLSDTLVACPNDPELKMVLEEAVALGGISFDLLEVAVAVRLIEVLKDTIFRSVMQPEANNFMWKTGLDDLSQTDYVESLQELGEMLGLKKAL